MVKRSWLMVKLLAVVGLGGLLFACGGSDSGLSATTGTPASMSLSQSYVSEASAVDILIVLDSSGTLDEERSLIALAVPKIISELTETASHSVAFLLGWGSEGPADGYEGSGHLYRVNGNPYVLDSSLMSQEDMIGKIAETLNTAPPKDAFVDEGEAGVYALHNLLTDPVLTDEARQRGFFREGAALVVVFISDENDICAVYPPGVTPAFDTSLLEGDAREALCLDDSGELYVTTAAVNQAAQDVVQGAPVLFTGMVYTGPYVPWGIENEIGYGYLDLIELTGGVAVDLASVDFGPGARNLGNSINALTADLLRRFILEHGPVNPLSIEVLVDGERETFTFNKLTNELFLDYPGHSGSTIEINYRVLEQ